jgi:hypothetical protein
MSDPGHEPRLTWRREDHYDEGGVRIIDGPVELLSVGLPGGLPMLDFRRGDVIDLIFGGATSRVRVIGAEPVEGKPGEITLHVEPAN